MTLNKLLIALMSLAFIVSCKSKNTDAVEYQAQEKSNNSSRSQRAKGPMSIEDIFKMDADNDGFLSKSEVKGRIAKDFDNIDTDDDGLISKKEMENAPKPERGQRGGQRGDR